MLIFGFQAMMSVRGYDIPIGKTKTEVLARQELFDIIHPYVLSAEDMKIVNREDEHVRALWFETFTNAQKGVLLTSLGILSKEEFSTNFFPPKGSLPPPECAALMGLPPGKSFLHR